MRAAVFSLVFLLTLGCQKSEPQQESKRSDSDSDSAAAKVEAIDPNLAEAVAQASVMAPNKGAPPAQVEGGPPPDGVFPPGGADKELPRGGLPKVTLGSDGSEPRLELGVAKTPSKLSGTIQIAVQSDPRQGAIPILMGVTLEPKKQDGAAAAADGAQVSKQVVVRVTSAKIDAPQVPKDLDEQIAKLKGSRVEYSILPSGAGAGFRFEAPKGAPADLADMARSLSDVLALVTLPYPDKPLGAGAYFMVTSRDELMGLDLVTYRLVKVRQVTGQTATLDVNTRRYAASRSFELAGLDAGAPRQLLEFQAESQGVVELPVGALMPTHGEISSVLAAQLGQPGAKKPMAAFQLQSRTQIDLK